MTLLKRIIPFMLIAALLAIPCSAADEDETLSVLDAAELDALLAPVMEAYGLDEENFGMGFLYTGTNESYYINGDGFFYAASLYKVPLCMLLAEKVSSGELSQDDIFSDVPITVMEERCIIGSSNGFAANLYNAFGPDADRLLASYSGMDYESLPESEFKYYYSPRFMLNTLRTLYEDPERFPNIIECMLRAQPGNYFRQHLEGRYDVAQKYGQYHTSLNNAGIIYTPTPVILVVMTDSVNNSMTLIAELAEIMAEYSLTLDEKIAALEAERLAAEEAARIAEEEAAEAERQRIAAEEAARREAERIAEEARLAAEQAKAEQAAAEAAAAEAKQQQRLLIIGGSSALIILITLLFILRKRK